MRRVYHRRCTLLRHFSSTSANGPGAIRSQSLSVAFEREQIGWAAYPLIAGGSCSRWLQWPERAMIPTASSEHASRARSWPEGQRAALQLDAIG